jgi:hypothetical protein
MIHIEQVMKRECQRNLAIDASFVFGPEPRTQLLELRPIVVLVLGDPPRLPLGSITLSREKGLITRTLTRRTTIYMY